MNEIYEKFRFCWQYLSREDDYLKKAAQKFGDEYKADVITEELKDEILTMKRIHEDNLGPSILSPLDLLNRLHELQLASTFHNVTIVLQIFLVIPVTVASGERSFSKLKYIENDYRTSMTQQRLNNLAILNIESDVARQMDFTSIIKKYARIASRCYAQFFLTV